MKHYITENLDDILLVLNDFFEKKYTRKSTPKFDSSFKKEAFEFASQIYKRGFLSQQKLETDDHIIPVPTILPEREFLNFLENSTFSNEFYFIDENLFNKQEKLQLFLKNKNYFLYSPNESSKSIYTVKNFIDLLPNSTESIFAMGGGILLDIVGFVAGILHKKVFYLPSTLLASVDAGIGGKTGVNFYPYGKNQLGLFYEAENLFCVPEYFLSLSYEEIICGVVESIKHSWIFGEFHNDYEAVFRIYNKNCKIEDFYYLVSKSIKYKSNIVNQDLFEAKDIRTSLNFGHTLAHVLEALGEEHVIQYMPHGIAVAHGLFFIFNSGLITQTKDQESMIEILKNLTKKYPIVHLKKTLQTEIEKYLIQDKKNEVNSLCLLSLPSYGHFSLLMQKTEILPVTQKFSITYISKLMKDYINTFS